MFNSSNTVASIVDACGAVVTPKHEPKRTTARRPKPAMFAKRAARERTIAARRRQL
jgi:hypothetical protein